MQPFLTFFPFNDQGALACGTEGVASAELAIPQPDALKRYGPWLEEILSPSRRVVLASTDSLEMRERRPRRSEIINENEAGLVIFLTKVLLEAGVAGSSIGIISPYRAQVELLERLIEKDDSLKSVEALTIDRAQGRDKDVILVSMVRSNEEKEVGQLLQDERRVNVLVSRAKVRLLLIGSWSTLCTSAPMNRIYQHTVQHHWQVEVSENITSFLPTYDLG